MDDEATNSISKDDALDQVLIDFVPIPPESKDDSSRIDPDNPFSMF